MLNKLLKHSTTFPKMMYSGFAAAASLGKFFAGQLGLLCSVVGMTQQEHNDV